MQLMGIEDLKEGITHRLAARRSGDSDTEIIELVAGFIRSQGYSLKGTVELVDHDACTVTVVSPGGAETQIAAKWQTTAVDIDSEAELPEKDHHLRSGDRAYRARPTQDEVRQGVPGVSRVRAELR